MLAEADAEILNVIALQVGHGRDDELAAGFPLHRLQPLLQRRGAVGGQNLGGVDNAARKLREARLRRRRQRQRGEQQPDKAVEDCPQNSTFGAVSAPGVVASNGVIGFDP